jgi:hypothetical protein
MGRSEDRVDKKFAKDIVEDYGLDPSYEKDVIGMTVEEANRYLLPLFHQKEDGK